MSLEIKIYYEYRSELDEILRKLGPDVKRWKIAGRKSGRFECAYIDLELSNSRKNDNEPRANRGEK